MNFIEFISGYEKRFAGVYIAYKLSKKSEKGINNLQNELVKLGYPEEYLETDLHCTVIFSERELIGNPELNKEAILAKPVKLSLFGENKNFLVLEIESKELTDRNRELVQTLGFISNFQYNPHITLFKKLPNLNFIDTSSIEFECLEIELVNEYIQELE